MLDERLESERIPASMVETVMDNFDTGMEYRCSKEDIDYATRLDERRESCSKGNRMIQVGRKSRGEHHNRLGRTWLVDWKLDRLVQSRWYMANPVVADPLVLERRYTTHNRSVLAVGSRLTR
jgi:hypothetical protein